MPGSRSHENMNGGTYGLQQAHVDARRNRRGRRAAGADGRPCRVGAAMEADEAHHHHRAVGGGRIDRSGHPRDGGGDREGARTKGRHRQSARGLRLDRHQERAGSAEGRLHLDGRRGAGPRYVRGPRDARHQDWRLGAVPERRQCLDALRESEHAVQDTERAHRGDEGEAGRDQRRDRRCQLERPQRDGGDRQGDRRQVQARHLRRRQSRPSSQRWPGKPKRRRNSPPSRPR